MKPAPGRKKTVLISKCIYKANKSNCGINEMIAVRAARPGPRPFVTALHPAGILVNSGIFDNLEQMPGRYMRRYENKPGFEESFFRIA